MKYLLKCSQCGQVMGHLEKDEVTDEDRAAYAKMVTCDQGHDGSTELILDDQGSDS